MPRRMRMSSSTEARVGERREVSGLLVPHFGLRLADTATTDPAGDSEDTTAAPLRMSGYTAVFGEWIWFYDWEYGRVQLTLAPTCFDRSLAESADRIRCIYEHGYDPSMGMRPIGSIVEMRTDATGLWTEVDLLECDFVEDYLAAALRAGLLGASFSGEIIDSTVDTSLFDAGQGPVRETVTEIALSEFGPCWRGRFDAPKLGIAASDERARVVGQFADRLLADDELRTVLASRLGGEAPVRTVASAEPAAVTSAADPAELAERRTRALALASLPHA